MNCTGRVVVTGGAGFIGTHVCRALHERGFEVVVVDDLSTGLATNLTGLPIDLVEGSILDGDLLERIFRGAVATVHLAARPSVPRSLHDPVATHDVNATGTVRVLEAARAVGAHAVIASSSSVYGAHAKLPKRESATPSPLSPYAASKLAGESYALAYLRCYRLPVLVFRLFNVFGPLQRSGHAYAAVIPRFVESALTDRPLMIHGDGRQTRDFTYVGIVAQVISAAIQERVTYDGPVNLAFGARVSLLEVIAQLERMLGRSLARQHAEARVGDVRHSQADGSRVKLLFPRLQPVDFSVCLAATVDWFRATLATTASAYPGTSK